MTEKLKWKYVLEMPLSLQKQKKLYGLDIDVSLLNIYLEDNLEEKEIFGELGDLIISLIKQDSFIYAQLLNPFDSIRKISAVLSENKIDNFFDFNFKENKSKEPNLLTVKCFFSEQISFILRNSLAEAISFFCLKEYSGLKIIEEQVMKENTSQFEKPYLRELERYKKIIFWYHLHAGISLFGKEKNVLDSFVEHIGKI